jgi:hypothetical protein
MNFTRPSQRENLLFVIVLLLPPLVAGARYIESVRQLAHISNARPGWQDRIDFDKTGGAESRQRARAAAALDWSYASVALS